METLKELEKKLDDAWAVLGACDNVFYATDASYDDDIAVDNDAVYDMICTVYTVAREAYDRKLKEIKRWKK